MLHGIDISNHNHPINPGKLTGDFVIMRASEGKGMRDPHFAGYDQQIRPSTKLAGAYHFMWVGRDGQLINTAKSEAENFARAVEKHLRPGFLLVADWEPDRSRAPLARNTGWAVEFAHEVRRLTGRTPLLYANRSTLDGGDWATWRAEIGTDYWLAGGTAQYAQRVNGYLPGTRGRNPWGFSDPTMWQFTEHGYLPGWEGRLDLNRFYGDAARWRQLADGTTPGGAVTHPTIPVIREADPPVHLFHHHGGQLRTSRGAPRLGCVCMRLTFPLVEQEMLRRGIIRHQIDVFQAGYNRGGVAASAGTHDMGGVIDVAQGITREQRGIWADYGWMMAPRTRAWGWNTGDHGHGVLHGCVHRSPSAARQIVSMMGGRNGLVSNTRVNWVAPGRPWQDTYREQAATPTPPPVVEEDIVPEMYRTRTTFNHPGSNHPEDYSLIFPEGKSWPDAVPAVPVAAAFTTTAQVHAPNGVNLKLRYAELDGPNWKHHMEGAYESPKNHPNHVNIGLTDECGNPLYLDIWASEPCEITVEQQASYWPK